jgi:single-stranded DNA-binding protein
MEMTVQGDAEMRIVGRLAKDPALAYTPGGQPWTNITVMTSPRYFDREQSKWCDGESSGWRVTVWGHMAEHVCESFKSGDLLLVLATITREKRQDNGEWVDRITAVEIGASVRWNQVEVRRTERTKADAVTAGASDPWSS